jgi:hypothetical protein
MASGEVARGGLFGVWRLVSARMTLVDSGEEADLLGGGSKGHAIFHPSGRMMVVLTAAGRTAPGGEGMTAYTGRFRIEGNRLVTSVDAAWAPAWEGTEQPRFFELDGERLTLSSEPNRNHPLPGVLKAVRVEWEREG